MRFLILFGKGVYENKAIELDQYTKQWDLVKAIEKLRFEWGDGTATGEGIKYMRTTLFAKSAVSPSQLDTPS